MKGKMDSMMERGMEVSTKSVSVEGVEPGIPALLCQSPTSVL